MAFSHSTAKNRAAEVICRRILVGVLILRQRHTRRDAISEGTWGPSKVCAATLAFRLGDPLQTLGNNVSFQPWMQQRLEENCREQSI